eukprot:m.178556 g.178556  ORF g.178556 m.178556 type:complete len:69 (-) comp16591_c0_seq1:1052-1258(-)
MTGFLPLNNYTSTRFSTTGNKTCITKTTTACTKEVWLKIAHVKNTRCKWLLPRVWRRDRVQMPGVIDV